MRPNIRKQSVAAAIAARTAPRVLPGYRGVRYTVTQDAYGIWRWNVQPANGLHIHDHSMANGFSPSRERAEDAARAAIDAQLDG